MKPEYLNNIIELSRFNQFWPDVLFLYLMKTVENQRFSDIFKLLYKGSSIKYVRKIFGKTNISNPLIRTRMCAYQGLRNVGFLEHFAYILNEWPLTWSTFLTRFKSMFHFYIPWKRQITKVTPGTYPEIIWA